MTYEIAIIVGSLRRDSFNRKLTEEKPRAGGFQVQRGADRRLTALYTGR
jgi:hypothetical protein